MSKLGREILADERAAQARNNVLERYAPWRIGEYIVTERYSPNRRPSRSYVIYNLKGWDLGHIGRGLELFECTTKRGAMREARRLSRELLKCSHT